jgi:hypothetical protein
MRKHYHRLACLLLGLLLSFNLMAAEEVALNPAHPDRYVVVKGDTLWDISGRFLREPWRWPDVWYANPQIANPHLIYPGTFAPDPYRGPDAADTDYSGRCHLPVSNPLLRDACGLEKETDRCGALCG